MYFVYIYIYSYLYIYTHPLLESLFFNTSRSVANQDHLEVAKSRIRDPFFSGILPEGNKIHMEKVKVKVG